MNHKTTDKKMCIKQYNSFIIYSAYITFNMVHNVKQVK